MTILDQLAEHARARVHEADQTLPRAQLQAQALKLPKGNFAFEHALKKADFAFVSRQKQLPERNYRDRFYSVYPQGFFR